jgi:hypothetical protein
MKKEHVERFKDELGTTEVLDYKEYEEWAALIKKYRLEQPRK